MTGAPRWWTVGAWWTRLSGGPGARSSGCGTTYPLTHDVDFYLGRESRLARLLGYGVISPRLQAVYEWSAETLREPRLCALIDRGCPRYAWEPTREVWQPARPGAAVRAVRTALPLRV